MEEPRASNTKTISPVPSIHDIERSRNIFVTRFIARFIQKHKKYTKLLQEHGASLPEAFSTFSINFCAPFEDEVEMIVSEKRQKIKHACRIKGVYSIKGLFRQIYQVVRRARAARIESKLLDIPNSDIIESLNDIAWELAIAYEYQISVLESEQVVRQLADHAISCTMNYLKQSEATFSRCSVLEAITDVLPTKSLRRAEKVLTRIMKTDNVKGTRPQTWRLSEIFKQPGLRLPDNGSGYIFYGCFTPYGSLCRPNKYGFRGPLHVWDENLSSFVLLYNDQVSCSVTHRREIERDFGDIHQNYEPVLLCSHLESQTPTLEHPVDNTNKPKETASNTKCNENDNEVDKKKSVSQCSDDVIVDLQNITLRQAEIIELNIKPNGQTMQTTVRNSDIENANTVIPSIKQSSTNGCNISEVSAPLIASHSKLTAANSDVENFNITSNDEQILQTTECLSDLNNSNQMQ